MTEPQYQELVDSVFNLLISNPSLGLGDIGEAYDAAKNTIDKWIDNNNIEVI